MSTSHRIALVVWTLAAVACGEMEPDPPHAAVVTVEPDSAMLDYADTVTFKAVVLDQCGAEMMASVTWSSTDEYIVTVDQDGKATGGPGVGTATIKLPLLVM